MQTHIVKTDPLVFMHELNGSKPFMFRVNDRNYQVGDRIISQCTRFTGEEMKAGKPLEYTGDIMICEITYIFNGPFYTLSEGSCIMAFKHLA